MSNVVSRSDPLTSSEITMIDNLAALATTPAGQAIAKTGATTFANVSASGSGSGFTYTDELIGTGDGDGMGGGTTVFNLANVPTNPAGMFLFGYGGFGTGWKFLQGALYDYTVSGTAVIFTQPPLKGIKIVASYA